jgi:hypothetical protein
MLAGALGVSASAFPDIPEKILSTTAVGFAEKLPIPWLHVIATHGVMASSNIAVTDSFCAM